MSNSTMPDGAQAALDDDATLSFQRRLPGPIERVWSYLTDSALRAQWLAAGTLPQASGSAFELLWRNDDLSDSPAERPQGFGEESRAVCQLIEIDAPHTLRFSWPGTGEVSIHLQPDGGEVLLTLRYSGCTDPALRVMTAAGWHVHLDILQSRLRDTAAPSFWSSWSEMRQHYGQRLAA